MMKIPPAYTTKACVLS